MKKILFLTYYPTPYRVDFFNGLGKKCELVVLFEKTVVNNRNADWRGNRYEYFTGIELTESSILGKKYCQDVFSYLKKDWDKIVICGYSTLTQMLSIIFLRLKRKSFFIEVDGGLIRNDNVLKRIIKRILVKSATAWFSSGKTTTDYLVHYGADIRKCYEYPFTSLTESDIEKYQNKNYREQCISKIDKDICLEQKNVLFVGQFIHRKGIDLIIKAANQLQEYNFILVGDVLPEKYETLLQDLKLSNVLVMGYKNKDQLDSLYFASDIFLLPTREDIWGLVVNEALAHGLPVITTDKCVAGLNLINENRNGSIIKSDSIDMIVEAVRRLVDKKPEMSSNCISSISGHTIEKMVEEHSIIFGIQ